MNFPRPALAVLALAPALLAQARPAAPATAAPAAPAATAAVAQGKPNPACADKPRPVAFVNLQRLIGSTDEGKQKFAALKARMQPTEDKVKALEDEIVALEKELQAPGLTVAQKTDLQRQIDTKTRAGQQQTDNANSDFQSEETDIANAIGQKLMPLIERWSLDHCVSHVIDLSQPFPQNPILWADGSLDLTDTMIALYNKTYPAGK